MGLDLTLEESDARETIPDGKKYRAKVVAIKLKEKPFTDDDGKKVVKVEWKFKIDSDDDQDGREIWGETSTKFVDNANCKLKNWMEAACGRIFPPGWKVNTDDALDEEVMIIVRLRTGEKEESGVTTPWARNDVFDVQPTPESITKMKASISDLDEEPF